MLACTRSRGYIAPVPTLDSRAPLSEPVALISDIHGRLDALDAVLEETRRQGAKRVYVAGDLLNGGPDPLGVWRRLTEIKAYCVRGVSDSALCSVDASKLVPMNEVERQKLAAFLSTRKTVGELVLESLRRLPLSMRLPLIDGGEIVIVHGSPSDPFQELTQDMDDDEILAMVADDPADIVVCGASHVPFQRVIDGVHVVNVGSVGAAPEGRIAHYTILTPTPGQRTVEQNWIDY
jgi:predicted phosphodiesterase